MDTFTLYVVVRAARALDDAAVSAMGGLLRPDDQGLCIWRDDADPTLVRVSTDVRPTTSTVRSHSGATWAPRRWL